MERFDIRGHQLSDKENWQRGHFLSIGRPIRESELTPSEGASFDLGQFVEAQTLEGLILSRIEKPFCTFTFLTYIVEMGRDFNLSPLDVYSEVFNHTPTIERFAPTLAPCEPSAAMDCRVDKQSEHDP